MTKGNDSDMAWKKWMRILFPELQLLDHIRERGFSGKKAERQQQPETSPFRQSGMAGQSQSLASSAGKETFGPLASGREAVADTVRGWNKHAWVRSRAELDDLFPAIIEEVNGQINRQEPFVYEVAIAYKKSFLLRESGKVQHRLLLAGPEGTGKLRTLSLLLDQFCRKRLLPYGHVTTVDLDRYGEREAHTLFLLDCANAFRDGIGTVCFRGIERAGPEIVQYVTKLFADGLIRTPEGGQIEASDYFLVLHVDQPSPKSETAGAAEQMERRTLEKMISPAVPQALVKSLDTCAFTAAPGLDTLAKLLGERCLAQAERLEADIRLTLSFEESVFQELAKQVEQTKRYEKAIEEWVTHVFTPQLLDWRARGVLRSDQEALVAFREGELVLVSGAVSLPLPGLARGQEQELSEALLELEQLTGLDAVKKFVRECLDVVTAEKKRSLTGQTKLPMSMHMVFSGNPGTGKTTVARLVARIWKSMGLLSGGQLVEVTRQDLVGEYIGSTAAKTAERIKEAIGGVLFIDEAYTLSRDPADLYGREAIDTLVKAMEDHRDQMIVILAGYTREMDAFLKVNPGLRSRFPLQIEFPDYTPEEMAELLERMVIGRGYEIHPDARQHLLGMIEGKQVRGRSDTGNGRLVRNLFEEAVRRQSARLAQLEAGAEEWRWLRAEDWGIGDKERGTAENIMAELEEELAAVVGLEPVKYMVRSLAAQIQIAQRRKAAGIPDAAGQTLHMIFQGNPGTGKTTVARIIARQLYRLGVIKRDELIETDRSGLVAGYVGQTALKTREVIERALGGVLFIDEAYALAGAEGDFGREAIDTLVKAMDDFRDSLVVILAGYGEDMTGFLASNPGLRSRFPTIIEFPDYTPDELLQITRQLLAQRGYEASAAAERAMRQQFVQTQGDKMAGNGRFVRNLCERAIRSHAMRLSRNKHATIQELTMLEECDVVEEAIYESS
ncbi:AAA family ATPase [Brevibacillus borstelensis]